jgi:hypothetical protein
MRSLSGWRLYKIAHKQENNVGCAPGSPETHMVGSERFVCVLCKHVTFAGSDGASRFPFTFDKVAAGR